MTIIFTLYLIFYFTSSDCVYFFKDLNDAEFLMSRLIQLIEKQSSENKNLQVKNCSLERGYKNLADKNSKLLKQVEKLEKRNSDYNYLFLAILF